MVTIKKVEKQSGREFKGVPHLVALAGITKVPVDQVA